jgi:hypothetical protein
MDSNKILILILALSIFYLFKKQNKIEKEGMTNTAGIAQADLDAIKNLAQLAQKLQTGGSTLPGDLITLGNIKVGNGQAEWSNIISLTAGAKQAALIDFLNKDSVRNTFLMGNHKELYTPFDMKADGNLTVGNGQAEWSNLVKIYGGTKQAGLVEFLNKDGARNTFLMGNPQQLYTPNDFKADGAVISASVTAGPITATSLKIGNITLADNNGVLTFNGKGIVYIYVKLGSNYLGPIKDKDGNTFSEAEWVCHTNFVHVENIAWYAGVPYVKDGQWWIRGPQADRLQHVNIICIPRVLVTRYYKPDTAGSAALAGGMAFN